MLRAIYCAIAVALSTFECLGAPFKAADSCDYNVNIILTKVNEYSSILGM